MPRLKGSADLLEDRRRRALALLDTGLSLNEVGHRIGCPASSVMRWCGLGAAEAPRLARALLSGTSVETGPERAAPLADAAAAGSPGARLPDAVCGPRPALPRSSGGSSASVTTAIMSVG